MTTAWVIGAGGLLGGGLSDVLMKDGTPLFRQTGRFDWTSETRLHEQIATSAGEFADQAGNRDWEVYWAAGTGTMRCSDADMQPETSALHHLLQQLENSAGLRQGRGRVCLASSAGAIYAGSSDSLITEESEPAPNTPYAAAKLEQEQLVVAFVARMGPGVTASLARISTLYGVGQAAGKAQGLISHLARQIVRNRPVHIFVPLDTIRDYIAVEDAARRLVAANRDQPPGSGAAVRIIASENPVTIAEIVSTFRRLSRRRPAIVTSGNRQTAVYTRCVRFRSIRPVRRDIASPEPLALGIARIMESERRLHARGV